MSTPSIFNLYYSAISLVVSPIVVGGRGNSFKYQVLDQYIQVYTSPYVMGLSIINSANELSSVFVTSAALMLGTEFNEI